MIDLVHFQNILHIVYKKKGSVTLVLGEFNYLNRQLY
jgi:hypothetical protein